MSRQFEQPQYPNDAEEFQQIGLLLVFEHHVHVKAQGGYEVDDVYRRLQELYNVGSYLKQQVKGNHHLGSR